MSIFNLFLYNADRNWTSDPNIFIQVFSIHEATHRGIGDSIRTHLFPPLTQATKKSRHDNYLNPSLTLQPLVAS